MDTLQRFVRSPVKASSIVGTTVVNASEENLGSIREIVIDPDTGQVAYAAVSFGGFLGLGEKLFAIPFRALAWRVEKNDYVLDISKERLEAAPGFDPDHWPTMSDEQWNRDVNGYYGRSP